MLKTKFVPQEFCILQHNLRWAIQYNLGPDTKMQTDGNQNIPYASSSSSSVLREL